MRNLPKKHQTLLFNAIMLEKIEAFAQEYLSQPIQVKVGRISNPIANVIQTLKKVSDKEKIDKLLALLTDQFSQTQDMNQVPLLTVVFVERKARCDEMLNVLVE